MRSITSRLLPHPARVVVGRVGAGELVRAALHLLQDAFELVLPVRRFS